MRHPIDDTVRELIASTVPGVQTPRGVLQIVARCANGNEGIDDTDELSIVNGSDSARNDADVAPPFGVLDLGDVQAFIGAFGAGCP